MNRRFLAGLVLALLPWALSCRPSESEESSHDEHTHHEDAADEHGGEAAEDAADGSLPLAGVRGVTYMTVGAPQQESVWHAAEAIAEESAVARLTTPVAGIVTSLAAAPGERVGKGAVIARLASPEVADLKAAWLTAQARHLRSARDLEREQRLLAGQATSRRDVEVAEADAAVAAAEEQAARLALSARGLAPDQAEASYTVRAPRAGVVASLTVRLGQALAAGETLGEVQSGEARLVRVELPLPAPEAWIPGAASEVRRSDGRRWAATVEGIPAALADDTRRLAFRLRLSGELWPLPGTPLEARVPLARGIVLPQGALQQIEGTWGVFVREGEIARFRPVRKGVELGGDVLVLEGLSAGEVIAAEGAYLLKALHLKRAGGGGGHDH